MPLRRWLILVTVGLLTAGLIAMALSTYVMAHEFIRERDDKRLTETAHAASQILATRPEGRLALPAADGDARQLWKAAATDGGLPAFYQIRDRDGRILQTIDFDAGIPVPDRLPAGLMPRRPTGDNPDGQRFRRLEPSGKDDDDGPPWAETDYRVRTSWIPGDRGILIVGARTSEADELLGQLTGVLVVGAVAALIGVGLVTRRAIRRGLRPLEEIAVTAKSIGDGDLTQRVDSGEPRTEVGQLAQALNAMLGQLESAFQERALSEDRLRRFIADASHELRTPIATVRGYAELFRRGAADRPEDLAKAMHRIESETERMGLLVDEMLLLARLDQGRPLEREPVDVSSLAADAVADARAIEPDRPVDLEAPVPVTVTGDAARLRQVLGNLLANVRAHTPASTSASVHVGDEDGRAVIEVADDGPGLTAEQSARVFERFYRADPARAREGEGDRGGAGLGLAIVAAIAAAHGGEVIVTAEPGNGARFRVLLPRA